MLAARILRILSVNALLLSGLAVSAAAQTTAVAAPPSPSPRLLLKAGLRLTHLVYQPDYQSWQLVLPLSLGIEYRVKPQLSLYAQAETDASSGRIPRGRRGALAALSTPTTDISLGARYYFNQPNAASPQASPETWGNYIALESSAGLTQNSTRGRRGRGLSFGRFTPAVFALCGTQHAGPGRRLLYDLNAGLGIEAPPAYTTDAQISPPWNVAAQVNLRVYIVNNRRTPKPVKP